MAEKMIETEAWLVLEPSFSKRNGELVATSMRITGVRKNRPESTRDPVVKLKIRIPSRLVTLLLAEAGFEVSPRSVRPVYPHPDDRHTIRASEDGHDLVFERSERDRRDPADAVFLSMPWHGERVPS